MPRQRGTGAALSFRQHCIVQSTIYVCKLIVFSAFVIIYLKLEMHVKGYLLCLLFITAVVNASVGISTKYTIDSDRQLILSNGNIKAIGNVHAVSGDMIVDADEAIYHRENPRNLYITAIGNPIKYKGVTQDGRPFSGRSKKFKYTPETGEVIMMEEAFIQQGENYLSGGVITYNTLTKEMTASSSSGKRVRSVIYPNKVLKPKR